jgi:hypothetical protein
MKDKDAYNRSIDAEGLRRKLWIVYLLMFVLPTGFLLYLVFELSRASAAGIPPLITTRLALLLGIPAAVVMSLAAFLLLHHSLSGMQSVVKTVERFLGELKSAEHPHPPPTHDEFQQLSH